MCHRSESFPNNALFMCFELQRFCSLSRRFMRFHRQPNIVLNSFSWPFFCSAYVLTMLECCLSRLQGMAGAIGLSNFLLAFFFFFQFEYWYRLNLSVVKLRFLFCPFLLFSILSGFTIFRPNFWPYIIWSGSRLNLCQSLTGPHVGRFSFNRVNFVTPLQESDKGTCTNRHSNNRQSSFLAWRPDQYE